MALNIQDGLLQPVEIQAVGDDFAQVGGAYLEGERIASHVGKADAAWAFATPSEEAALRLCETIDVAPDRRLIAMIPGRHPGWPAPERAALMTLLPGAETYPLVGLLLSVDAPPCAYPDRALPCDHCGQGCSGCGRQD